MDDGILWKFFSDFLGESEDGVRDRGSQKREEKVWPEAGDLL